MSKMIQIRNVPDSVHRALKARAALEGISLSSYILLYLERVVERPTRAELLARIARRKAVAPRVSAAAMVREERDSR